MLHSTEDALVPAKVLPNNAQFIESAMVLFPAPLAARDGVTRFSPPISVTSPAGNKLAKFTSCVPANDLKLVRVIVFISMQISDAGEV